jgi:hypothetical protein
MNEAVGRGHRGHGVLDIQRLKTVANNGPATSCKTSIKQA